MDQVARLEIKAVSGELVTAEKRLDRVEKQGRKTEKATDGVNKGFLNLERGTKTLSIGLAATAAATALMWKGFSDIRSGQKLEAMLRTASGSAEAAAITFSELSDTARQMPETLEDITRGFVKLTNLGLEPSERALLSYGDTASAMGKSLNDFIEAVADAATGENERLKEFGIKASKQGEITKFTFRGVTTAVRSNATEIEEYLTRLGEINFAGSMANQMDTIDGKLSNLSDSFFQFANALKDSKGVDVFSDAIGALSDRIDESRIAIKMNELEERFSGFWGASSIFTGNLKPEAIDISDLETAVALLDRMKTQGASNNALVMLEHRIKELRIQKELNDHMDASADLLERHMEGVEAIAEIEKHRVEYGLTEGERLDNQRIRNLEEIDRLYRVLSGHDKGNQEAAKNQIIKLLDENEKLNAKIGKEAVSKNNKFESFFDDAKTELQILQDKHASEMAFAIAHNLDLERLEAEHQREMREIQKFGLTGKLGGMRDFFNDLAILNQGESEKIFRIQKGFALADATVKGAQATANAYATGGPFPANLIAATLVGAKSAVEIAAIESQTFAGNYSRGINAGFVPGNSYSGDRMTAGVNSGEAILTPPQQREFINLANGRGSGGGSNSGSGYKKVEIHNYGGSRVEQRERDNGQTLQVIIPAVVNYLSAEAAQGRGKFTKTIEGVYGLRRGGS